MAVIAFNVAGTNNTSANDPSALPFTHPTVNEGAGWNGVAFIAPETGFYFFSISFVRDFANGGTSDDVYMLLRKGTPDNPPIVDIGRAWCGVGDGARSTATYSVVIKLNKGELVQPLSHSDGGRTRTFAKYEFSGFLIH